MKTRKFSELNQKRVGLIGIVATAFVLLVSVNIGSALDLFSNQRYTAEFSRAGGLRSGDEVRVSGVTVGKVTGIELAGDRVRIKFTMSEVSLGSHTRAAVKSANALGRKFLAVTPDGVGEQKTIPLDRTDRPYDVTNAFADLTKTTELLDVDQLAGSFDALAETFADTAPSLASTLQGVTGLSTTISRRDAGLRSLLERANAVTDVLATRSEEITRIIANGNALFQELELRRAVIRQLLNDTQGAATALRGLVRENEAVLRPTLRKLQRVTDVLVDNQKNIEFALRQLGPYARSVGEAVGGGPFYYAYVANLVAPSNLAPILPELIRKGD